MYVSSKFQGYWKQARKQLNGPLNVTNFFHKFFFVFAGERPHYSRALNCFKFYMHVHNFNLHSKGPSITLISQEIPEIC